MPENLKILAFKFQWHLNSNLDPMNLHLYISSIDHVMLNYLLYKGFHLTYYTIYTFVPKYAYKSVDGLSNYQASRFLI